MRSREVVVLFIYSLWLSASDLSSEVAISDVRRELVAASSSVRASRPWQPQFFVHFEDLELFHSLP